MTVALCFRHGDSAVADRAIYFACVNFFFFLHLLGAKLYQYLQTDFRDLLTKWKVFA